MIIFISWEFGGNEIANLWLQIWQPKMRKLTSSTSKWFCSFAFQTTATKFRTKGGQGDKHLSQAQFGYFRYSDPGYSCFGHPTRADSLIGKTPALCDYFFQSDDLVCTLSELRSSDNVYKISMWKRLFIKPSIHLQSNELEGLLSG